MQNGDVVEGRFDIETLAASGGMGQVFRGRDRQTGDHVAVKVILEDVGSNAARFNYEARALAQLSHPDIVRYVAHGTAASGQPYLAMEWLEGEDLASRLARAGLTIDESLELASRVALAIGAAHARGIVHRDLKPSNIFLVNGRLDSIKVLDFGIACLRGVTRVTQPGVLVGTPGYMAPEQIQNDRPVDARADVFSLGCVLFECLTGSPVFTGQHFMALLAKVLFAEPQRLRDVRPEAPAALEQLLARMLAKHPEERPDDGAAVAVALAALGSQGGPDSAPGARVSLTSGERRVISVVLIEGDRAPGIGSAATLDQAEVRALVESIGVLRHGAKAWGGQLELLPDGSLVVLVGGAGLPTDQAAQAARCALWLRTKVGGHKVALATGRSERAGRGEAATAIDRAVKLLLARAPEAAVSALDGLLPVAIDETTARLVEGRFDVREGEAGPTLHGEREIAEGARLLLGKPTACVGRDRELSTLSQMLVECIEEPLAQVALVTGTAGIGKSRLAHEFLARLRQRGAPIDVWICRGDVQRAGSSLGLLGQALRRVCGIRGDEPLPERRRKLCTRVASRIEASEQQRVAELLGEIMGVSFPDEASDLLRAARKEAQLMSDEMRRAWVHFLGAECRAQPVLLVLEDLHWGDLPTVSFVDTALRELRDRHFMVLALARPEVHELFPKLWAARRVQVVPLNELGKKASERLVRQVLGDEVSAEVAERLITQADGNAFYLEELIRATAEHRGEALPETVIAMVQSRLATLADEDRRALRAAAVFGEVFWPSGVAALLGGADRAAHVQGRLLDLVEREVLVRRPESRFGGEVELAFRHVLVREGAYAMLTDDDRTLGHRLAGEWLVIRGEADPMALAGHFERGGQPARAIEFYLRAAERAVKAGDIETAAARAQQGLDCGAQGEVRAALLGLLCELCLYRPELNVPYAEEVMRTAPPGSAPWAHAVSTKLMGLLHLGSMPEFMDTLAELLKTDPSPEALSSMALALSVAIHVLATMGQIKSTEAIFQRYREIVVPVTDRDPLALAFWNNICATRDSTWNEDPWSARRAFAAAQEDYKRAQHRLGASLMTTQIGRSLWALGALAEAERELRSVAISDEDSPVSPSLRLFYLSEVLRDRDKLDVALLSATELVETMRARRLLMDEGRGHLVLAEVLCCRGDQGGAEREAIAAVELLRVAPAEHIAAVSTLATVLLAQGRTAEALAASHDAMARYESMGGCGLDRAANVRLTHAECLHAAGDHEAARAAIAAARDRLIAIAATIGDPGYRRSFLEELPRNVRTLVLGRQWLTSR